MTEAKFPIAPFLTDVPQTQPLPRYHADLASARLTVRAQPSGLHRGSLMSASGPFAARCGLSLNGLIANALKRDFPVIGITMMTAVRRAPDFIDGQHHGRSMGTR
jgi:hypothetical protein